MIGSNANPDPSQSRGVIFNAYPDSIGHKLADTVDLLQRPELKNAFSLFYILPTFFHSDLDRGFSVIDYDINEKLVDTDDLKKLEQHDIKLKFDLVLNHLSVGSAQFQDMLQYGEDSKYKDFFIDWNAFWGTDGEISANGYVIPKKQYLDQLFMRKPGLPILKVRFPDGSERPYWNTFYQEVTYSEISVGDLSVIDGLTPEQARQIVTTVNDAIAAKSNIKELDFGGFAASSDDIVAIIESKRKYLGQMDLNAQSEQVWDFYDETLEKLSAYGAKLIRLDAFAYLHKEPGKVNFFNKPGTWDYLRRLRHIGDKYKLIMLPEIHSEYGNRLHEEVAAEGFLIYDFFLPGLVIDALDRGTSGPLLRWIGEIIEKNIRTVNMLGCHDGIPVLDLKGKTVGGTAIDGLLTDDEIDAVVERILDRGGRVKNLYGPDGKKIAYYQVNATYFSALGEDERKLRLARAIQMFMPGIPQVWYLDLFAGKNDYAAADSGATAGHKEINRTTLKPSDIELGLNRVVVRDQLELIRLRNTSPAFSGELDIHETEDHWLHLTWRNQQSSATLRANLQDHDFEVTHVDQDGKETLLSYR